MIFVDEASKEGKAASLKATECCVEKAQKWCILSFEDAILKVSQKLQF